MGKYVERGANTFADTAQLASGVATAAKGLRGDGSWEPIAAASPDMSVITKGIARVDRQSFLYPTILTRLENQSDWTGYAFRRGHGGPGWDSAKVYDNAALTDNPNFPSMDSATDGDGPALQQRRNDGSAGQVIYFFFGGVGRVVRGRYRSFYMKHKFKVPSAHGGFAADRTIRLGMFVNTPPGSAADPAGSFACFYWTFGQANWQFRTGDGVGASSVDTGVPVVADALYFFEAGYLPNGTMWFRVNGGTVQVKATDLPVPTDAMGGLFDFHMANNVATGVQQAFISYVHGYWW